MFIPQESLEIMLEEGRIDLQGDEIVLLADGQELARLQSTTALRFGPEVGGSGDMLELEGRVKTLAEVEGMSGEYCAGSVILGDYAYEALEGLLGTPA